MSSAYLDILLDCALSCTLYSLYKSSYNLHMIIARELFKNR